MTEKYNTSREIILPGVNYNVHHNTNSIVMINGGIYGDSAGKIITDTSMLKGVDLKKYDPRAADLLIQIKSGSGESGNLETVVAGLNVERTDKFPNIYIAHLGGKK